MATEQARALALSALLKVDEGASAHEALEGVLAHAALDVRDRGLVTELVDGTLRWQGRLDYQLQQLLERPLEQLPPAIRLLLRLGAYQLTLLERIPAHAAVNEAVALAHRHGHAGTANLVNAVLRRLQREHAALAFPNPATDPVGLSRQCLLASRLAGGALAAAFRLRGDGSAVAQRQHSDAGYAARQSTLDCPRRLAAVPGIAWAGN